MNIAQTLKKDIHAAFVALFGAHPEPGSLNLQPTRKEFEGSHTFITFPWGRVTRKKPEQSAALIGEYLVEHSEIVSGYNVVKGFLNIVISDKAWLTVFDSVASHENFGFSPANGKEVMVEYSSPNTNKPLHLGHLRNNFLGWSVAEILRAGGYRVHRVQIINDRGIHICKSMVAWQKFGNGETPQLSGLKGDKLVGKYYVIFDQKYKAQVADLMEQGQSKEEAEKNAPIMLEAQDMLRKWEQKDPEVYRLWQTMNQWVYDGFDETYRRMGVAFDKLYYESETFLLGREEVLRGLDRGIFFKKEDGSVWVDLTGDGLDEKLLLRADGTSVYMTQDIGTAVLRYRDFPDISRQIYTVGNEQEYHFKVLFLILDKLGFAWAKECYHLSYGMVDLPSGKMKSREGTVVDADDLMEEMVRTAEARTRELGKIEGFSEEQAGGLYEILGLGALKYFLLKVEPKKRMLFNPEESIEFQGNTGPFIQYTHARIAAIVRKAGQLDIGYAGEEYKTLENIQPVERELIYLIHEFPARVRLAAEEYSPSVIAQYIYDLAKEYNRFYAEIPIFNEENTRARQFRVALSATVALVIKKGMGLLGIQVPDRM